MRNGSEFRHQIGADIPDWERIVGEAKAAWQAVVDRASSKHVPATVLREEAWRAGLAAAYRRGHASGGLRSVYAQPAPVVVTFADAVPVAFHWAIRHPDGQVSEYRHREAVARQDLAELRDSDPSYAGHLIRYAVGAPETVD